MFKTVGFAIAFTLLCLGIWEMLLFFQYPGKSPDWKIVDGWLTEYGAEQTVDLPGGKKIQALSLLIEDQHATYVYFVDNFMYYKRQDLPPNLAPVRTVLERSETKSGNDTDSAATPGDKVDTTINTMSIPKITRPLAHLNEKTHRLEILTEPGMMISTNFATNYMGEKYQELPQEKWGDFLPKVKIKYNPANPNESITDPDILRGELTLLWTGITLIVSAFLTVGVIFFHAWVTKPSDADIEPSPSRRRY